MQIDSSQDKGPHQNIARANAALSVLAEAAADGLRASDIARATGFGKATTHRLLTGLASYGLIDFEEATGRYFLGLKILAWANAARARFDLSRLLDPVLQELCETTQDTVYLQMRTGDEVVCLDRREGSFPVKTLTLGIGDRRPLGMGAGSLAILAGLEDAEIERVLISQEAAREKFPFTTTQLREMIAATRRNGYAFNDIHLLQSAEIIHDMAAVGVPICKSDGTPIAAISVAAISSRMPQARRELIAAQIQKGIGASMSQL